MAVLTRETGGLTFASTITLVLQVNGLTKCAIHRKKIIKRKQTMQIKLRTKYTSNKNNNNIKKMSDKEYVFSIMSAFHVIPAYTQKMGLKSP